MSPLQSAASAPGDLPGPAPGSTLHSPPSAGPLIPAAATCPPVAPSAAASPREAALRQWLQGLAATHGIDQASLVPASADASFRRYFRLDCPGRTPASLVVMDAPPPLEDVRPFVHVAGLLTQAGLQAPRVLAADVEQGFLLLTDLGSRLALALLQAADVATADRIMRQAIAALLQFQQHVPAAALPPFDEALLRRELDLFPTWCIQREFGVQWTPQQQRAWEGIVERLVHSALAQPQLAVHADWMPRNLMLTPDGSIGVLDFQDAVRGPITYDLASLLRDAFWSWDEAQELDWAVRWWQQARQLGLPLGEVFAEDFGEFWRALEWMGLQRHLKVMGIFCRLKHRDGKPHYALDLPRFYGYAQKVALRYAPLKPLLGLLQPLAPAGTAGVSNGYTF